MLKTGGFANLKERCRLVALLRLIETSIEVQSLAGLRKVSKWQIKKIRYLRGLLGGPGSWR